MKNRSFSIDMSMVTRKFYCHKCGERLVKNPRTRIIKRGDPDYKKHSRIGRMHVVGDIEYTEYDFKCPTCDRIIECDEQYVVEKIQKKLGMLTFSEAEYNDNQAEARAAIERKKRITEKTVKIITVILIVLVFILSMKKGNLDLEFFF